MRRLLLGALLGAALAWWFDPASGRRRRARARDRLAGLRHRGTDAAGRAARDLAHRARGAVAATRGRLRGGGDDVLLRERVRATLGRFVAHPRAVTVSASAGHVVLQGPVLRAEVAPLLAALATVRGVHTVENRLTEHATAQGVPALQGGRPVARRTRWTPATRIAAGAAAAVAVGSVVYYRPFQAGGRFSTKDFGPSR